jgi:ankyrin repeat protein
MSDPRSTSVFPRRLPQQPSLEQLKKQAKELLERFRAGELAAVAEVRQFERNHPSHFALNDAQRVLARAYGFESWPKLKAFVDGATIARFTDAVKAGDMTQVRSMLASRPELVGMDRAGNDEHRGLHYAVLSRNAPMVKLLMEAGADARQGIWPNRDATSALTLARDREYSDIVAIIEEEERLRREAMSCPNATVSPVQDQISAAILQGDTATAMHLLEGDRSLIQACDRTGAAPLHIAAQVADIDLVAWLLERRANVRKQDMRGGSALDRAAQSAAEPRNERAQRFPALARLLLEHGAEITISAAVALGDAGRVRGMIAADPAALRRMLRNGGLLSLAVNHNQLEMAKLLLDLGADVDERVLLEELEEPTLSWGAPLWYAALSNQLEIARLLLDRGADPNANVYASGWPLSNAWNHEGGAIKRLLLERGARPQPHTVAANHDVAEARRLLGDNPSEHVMEELLWSAADHGCPEIVALTLAQIQWPLNERTSHWVLIQPIWGAGGDPAENEGQFASLDLILRKGIDPNVTRMGATTLHFTAARGGLDGVSRARFAAMLIDRGARLDLRDDLLKSTPLGWACRWGRLEMAEVLIKRGALVEEPDADPWAMPIAWARRMNHSQILSLLDGNLGAGTPLS